MKNETKMTSFTVKKDISVIVRDGADAWDKREKALQL